MKKEIKILGVLFLSALLGVTAGALAKGPSGQAGNSNVAHLYLHEKNPETWEIIDKGAWGKMQYFMSGEKFDFVFNGHGLQKGTNYTLIYYPDPWPGNGLICLGKDTANGGGNVHMNTQVDTCDMPAPYDANYPEGAKIWLVLSEDVDCENQAMTSWHPTEYLFEYQLMTFEDTDCDWPTSECSPGETVSCGTGELGVCAAGTKTCDQDGSWGDCVRNQEPVDENPFNENCNGGLDEDCDGLIDMADPGCSGGIPD